MTMRKFSRLWIPLIAAISIPAIGGFIVWLALQKPLVNADEAELADSELPAVETTPLQMQPSVRIPRTYSGTIRAARTSELGFNRTGRLASVQVSQGDKVAEQAILAELDTSALRAQLAELQAQRQGAESLLAELRAGPRLQTIAAAKTEVADLEAQLSLAQLDFERRSRLRQSGSIAEQEFDEARLTLSSIEQRLQGARLRLSELEEGTRKERIAAQQAELLRLEAAIERTQVEINESRLLAPYAAVVSQRLYDEGSIVPAGSAMFRLVEQGAREAWIGIPAELTSQLDPNASYELIVDHQTYPAKLHAILPELDSVTRTQTAIFHCQARQQTAAEVESSVTPNSVSATGQQPWCDLAPGQLVRIRIEQTVEQSGFWIPIKALTRGQRGLWSAFVIRSDSSQPTSDSTTSVCLIDRRDVEILQVDSDRVLVRGDIQHGDELITTGTHRLVSGQKVQRRILTQPAQQD